MLLILLIVFNVLVLLGCVLYLVTRHLEDRYIFSPDRHLIAMPSEIGLDYEEIEIKASDGCRLRGWHIHHDQPKAVVICWQGNAHNRSYRLNRIQYLHELGFDIWMVDYRGYGDSEGAPSEDAMYRDAVTVYNAIYDQITYLHLPFITYGVSLGGIISLEMATKCSMDGVILESTFGSVRELARWRYPILPLVFLKYHFDAYARIKKINAPLLMIHSCEDDVTPIRFARSLFEKAIDPKLWLMIEGEHDGIRSPSELDRMAEAIDIIVTHFDIK